MKQVLVSAEDAFSALRRDKTVFYIYRGEQVYVEPDTMFTAHIIEHSLWFVEKEEIFTVDNAKRVCYSIVRALKNTFRRKQL